MFRKFEKITILWIALFTFRSTDPWLNLWRKSRNLPNCNGIITDEYRSSVLCNSSTDPWPCPSTSELDPSIFKCSQRYLSTALCTSMDVVCTSGISRDRLSFSRSSLLLLVVIPEGGVSTLIFFLLSSTFSEDLMLKTKECERINWKMYTKI